MLIPSSVPQLSAQTTVLTPNRRLSVQLSQDYKQQGVSLQPQIYPYQDWLQQCFADLTDAGWIQNKLLLSPLQTRQVWRHIIETDPLSDTLLRLEETLSLAINAWQNCQQWQIEIDHWINDGEASQAFQHWAHIFQDHNQEHGYLHLCQLESILIPLATPARQFISDHIQLQGFDDLTPVQSAWLQALVESGVTLHKEAPLVATAQVTTRVYRNLNEEIDACAQWACQQRQAHPNQYLAIVCPQLNQYRHKLQRQFSQIFAPRGIFEFEWKRNEQFNISAGQTLTNFPVVATALRLLTAFSGRFDSTFYSYLLRSPHLGDANTEQFARAKWDRWLQAHAIYPLSVQDCIALSQDALPKWCERWQAAAKSAPKQHTSLSMSLQIQYMRTLLQMLGWPGQRSPNSEEFQVVQRFEQLLDECLEISELAQCYSYNEALNILKQAAQQTQYQIQSPKTPIQILGSLEAAGLPFDAMWIMGLSSDQWPPRPAPNPFVPYDLQRTNNFPHASSEREYHYCQRLQQRFSAQTSQLIYSYHEWDDDRPLLPSPLISTIEPDRQTTPIKDDLVTQLFQQRPRLVNVEDQYGPALSDEPVFKAGTALVADQAHCPFRAFAIHRLHACKIEYSDALFDPLQRGSILHILLERIWEQLKSSQQLSRATTNWLSCCIEQVLDELANTIISLRKPHYKQLEHDRLLALMSDWLKLESQRPPFSVIAREQQIDYHYQSIHLSMRIDRIDQLSDGSYLIIDYKTGRTNPINWLGERPPAPQCPLYVIAQPHPVSGVLFATVRRDQQGFAGFSQAEYDIIGCQVLEDWSQTVLQWQTNLHKLLDEFSTGYAAVEPHFVDSCDYCDLQGVCRIHED